MTRLMELSVGPARRPVVAVVPTSMAQRMRDALHGVTQVQFVLPSTPAAERHRVIVDAGWLIIDPSSAAGGGAEDVRVAACQGIPSVVVLSMSDASLARILAALCYPPLDVGFDNLHPSGPLLPTLGPPMDPHWSMQ